MLTHHGSCLCGAVRFEIAGDFESFFLCHCGRCRKGTGTAHGANLFSTTAKLQIVSGADKIKVFSLPDTRHTKSFCTNCGSPLPHLQMDGALLVVPAGSIDSALDIKPNAHICVASRADWDHGLEEVPSFDGLPG